MKFIFNLIIISFLFSCNNSDQTKDKIFEHTYQVSKYFVGHNLKINADYGHINEEQTTGDDKQTRTFRIQAQLKF